MATWTAKCWMGSDNSYQQLEVQANNHHGAVAQLKRVYGAEHVINCRQVRDNHNGGSGATVSLPSFGGLIKAIVVGGVVMWGLQFVPNKETQPTINSAPEVVETIQQTNINKSTGLVQRWEERNKQIEAHRNEFFNTSYQEEAIDDLGQDWDK